MQFLVPRKCYITSLHAQNFFFRQTVIKRQLPRLDERHLTKRLPGCSSQCCHILSPKCSKHPLSVESEFVVSRISRWLLLTSLFQCTSIFFDHPTFVSDDSVYLVVRESLFFFFAVRPCFPRFLFYLKAIGHVTAVKKAEVARVVTILETILKITANFEAGK
jgi:hypothetical protein